MSAKLHPHSSFKFGFKALNCKLLICIEKTLRQKQKHKNKNIHKAIKVKNIVKYDFMIKTHINQTGNMFASFCIKFRNIFIQVLVFSRLSEHKCFYMASRIYFIALLRLQQDSIEQNYEIVESFALSSLKSELFNQTLFVHT